MLIRKRTICPACAGGAWFGLFLSNVIKNPLRLLARLPISGHKSRILRGGREESA